MAMDALMSNNFVEDSGSYFVHDRIRGKWIYVPWDLNNSDARWWPTYTVEARPIVRHPIQNFSLLDGWVHSRWLQRKDLYPGYLPVFSNLNTRVLLNAELRAALVREIDRTLAEVFNPAVLHPRIEAMHALIAPHVPGDPYVDQQKFTLGRQYLKDFVTGRVAFVSGGLGRLRSWPLTLVIESFDPQGGTIELKNRSAAPVALGGKVLTTNLRMALSPNLPSVTLESGQSITLTASQLGLGAGFPAEGEVGLFDGVTVTGMLDALFYGAGRRYARSQTAPGTWLAQ
jgi:spore coat protein H